MFDGIAYGKAGAVIGMVENWVGPKVFQAGVHDVSGGASLWECHGGGLLERADGGVAGCRWTR